MRILLISLWYHPEPVTKPHDLAAQLARRGHQVYAITGFPNYPSGRLYPGYRLRPRQAETLDGARVVRVPHVVDRSQSALRRLVSYSSFAISAAAVGGQSVPRPDVIWTYQVGLPGVLLSALTGAPLVHEVQDLWPEWGHTAQLRGLKGGLYRLLDAQERWIYRRAAAVTTISEGFCRALMAKGVPQERLHLIANWANEAHFRPVPRDPELGRREGLLDRFNVMYVGNVGTAQGLGLVLATAERLRDLPKLQFVVIGDGVERRALETQAAERELSAVRFLGSRPPEVVAHYLAYADAVLLPLLRNPVYEITIPSKTYAYLAAGRPILVSAAGDVAELVRSAGAGVVCPPEDPDALALAIRRMAEMPEEQREALGQAGRQAFLSRFTRDLQMDRYEALFNKVAKVGIMGATPRRTP
ncbi:MAG: glycosyltransferase family 4 protein [Anaerolineae bacterium]|nr:glycosyltransferase family 4 protein [Anaerolineae bacterium]